MKRMAEAPKWHLCFFSQPPAPLILSLQTGRQSQRRQSLDQGKPCRLLEPRWLPKQPWAACQCPPRKTTLPQSQHFKSSTPPAAPLSQWNNTLCQRQYTEYWCRHKENLEITQAIKNKEIGQWWNEATLQSLNDVFYEFSWDEAILSTKQYSKIWDMFMCISFKISN